MENPNPTSKDDTIYNLTLYIEWIESHFPTVFKAMQDRFSGMPGYSHTIERSRE